MESISVPRLMPSMMVLAAGASAGFFVWSFTVSKRIFYSYIFFNNLTVQQRNWLILLLAAGASLFYLAWILLTVLSRLRSRPGLNADRIALYFFSGLLLGFWPLLSVQAIEIYYPLQAFLFVGAFLAVAFLIAHGICRQTQADPELSLIRSQGAERLSLSILVLLTAGYAIFFSIYTVSKHLSFHSYAFDLGWQNQVFYTLLHTGFPRVTVYVTLDHLSNHFQPLYYVLAPIYALHQDAVTLLVLQSVMLSSAAIPIYLIARKRLGDPWTALSLAVVYLLYPPLHGMNIYDFHGIVLLIPFMSFLLYGLEIRNYRLFWIFFALALITREDTAVSLAGVGLYLLLDPQRRRLGIVVLSLCLGYFILVMQIMSALGGNADLSNYWALSLPEHQNFTGVFITVLTNPQFVFKHVFLDPAKLRYLLHILLPVVFLPLFAGKAAILTLPGLMIILLSNYSPQYEIGFQYSAHVIAQVFFLSVLGIEKINKRWSRLAIPLIVLPLLVSGLLMNYEFGLVLSKRFPGFLKPTDRQRTVYSFFEQIPRDASVATTSRLVPHLATRPRIHVWQAPQPDTEYILVDLHPPEPATDVYENGYQRQELNGYEKRNYVLDRLESGSYGILRLEDSFILLKKGFDTSANKSAMNTILSTKYPESSKIIDYYSDPAENVNEPRYSQADLFYAFLTTHNKDTVVLSAKGDAAGKLSYVLYKYLMMRGSRINQLEIGGSYLAVIHEERVVLEILDNQRPVQIHSSDSPVLQSLFPTLELNLYSSGREHDGRASFQISGREYSLNQAGMNVVVLDNYGRVTEQAAFDTGR
jgi:uncharacterized membrane protein